MAANKRPLAATQTCSSGAKRAAPARADHLLDGGSLRCYRALVMSLGLGVLTACQSHLPALDDYPKKVAVQNPKTDPVPKPYDVPKVTDVVAHIQCELAKIANTKSGDIPGDGKSTEFLRRIKNNPDLSDDLTNKLTEFNFVATVQLSLEVTDMEGLSPSLTFQNATMGLHTGTLGGQWNGTQDRTITLNYAVDFSRFKTWDATLCQGMSSEGGQSGIQGDLGLADIVADGLLSLNKSAGANVYSSTGPTPPTVAHDFAKSGKVQMPDLPTAPPSANPQKAAYSLNFDLLRGTILFAPQSAGVLTQGTVNFSGIAKIDGQQFMASWTGAILPTNSSPDPNAPIYFTLSGPLVPDPSNPQLTQIENRWGFNPTITLTGTMDSTYTVAPIKLAGVITPAAGSQYARTGTDPIRVTLDQPGADFGGPSPPNPAAKGGPSSSAASGGGGTSFGSLVDFTLVYGLNGSPAFTWQHVKAITGASGPFATLMRTKTDSMAITFVPACRSKMPTTATFNSFWDSLAVCDQLTSARELGEAIGYQNNSLMILRNFLVRPQ
jgi:hypothetical protein